MVFFLPAMRRPRLSTSSGDFAQDSLPGAAITQQLARVLVSAGFEASPRASAFLSHVVERTLSGRAGEIKEVTIGVEVFNRPSLYDTRSDPVVRSVARVLREKLNDYYLNNPKDPVRIDLPKGSYIPVFRSLGVQDHAPVETPAEPRVHYTKMHVACGLLTIIVLLMQHPVRPAVDTPVYNPATLYELGRQRLLAGDFPGARPLLERAAARAPTNGLAHAALAVNLRFLSYDSRALEEARKAEMSSSGLTLREQLEVEAAFRSVSGDSRAAVPLLAQLRRLDPNRLEYARAMARAQMESPLFAACLRTIEEFRAKDDAQLVLTEAFCQAGMGDFQSAMESAKRAATLAQREGVREIYARARLLQSGLLMSTGHADQARQLREEAREICSAIGDNACVVRSLRVQGNADLWTAEPATALREYREALPLARELGSQGEIVELLNGEGWALVFMDEFSAAKNAFFEALLTGQKAGHSVTAVRMNLAEVASLEGQLDRAKILAGEAAAQARKVDDRNSETVAEAFESRVLMLEGDLDASTRHIQTARSRAEGAGLPDATKTAWTLTSAMLDRLRGNLDLAASEIQDAASTSDAATDAEFRTEQVELLIAQHRYIDAQREARQSMARLKALARQSELSRVTSLLSDAYGYAGELDLARNTADEAVRMLSPHSATLPRLSVLISAGRWSQMRADKERYLREAIDLAQNRGFRLAESAARQALACIDGPKVLQMPMANLVLLHRETQQAGLISAVQKYKPGSPASK
jgi:tetratricopeptide (TPR) repeat protein